MAQMTVTLEWDDDLGPRWLDEDSLTTLLDNDTIRIKSCTFPDDTECERAQLEFQELSQRIEKLGSLPILGMERDQRDLLQEQYDAMVFYRESILARINSWDK